MAMKITRKIFFSPKQTTRILYLVLLLLFSLYVIIQQNNVDALSLVGRSITLSTSEAGQIAKHTYRFTNLSSATLGSIKLEYCSNSPLFDDSCTIPAGLNLSSVNLVSQTGNVGFVIDPLSSQSTIVLSRSPSGALSALNTYVLSNITNPSTADSTFYVRISLYASIDTSGPSIDKGAVAFSTSGRLGVGAYVPPILTFCVGITVASNCSSTNNSIISFGELSSQSTASTTTQFAAATNDPTGLQVFLNGQTMTSGNNIISALDLQSGSLIGQDQFGINLRANTNPSVGSDPSGYGVITAKANYNLPNQFIFQNGSSIASSTKSTNFNVFTVSYIVNITPNQAPGVYASTLIYTAVVSF